MKVYLFNVENGLYEGEDFRAGAELDESEGVTNQAPPQCERGTVPVFDPTIGSWKAVAVASLKKVGMP